MPEDPGWVWMGQRDRDRLLVIRQVLAGERSQVCAAGLLDLSVRQVRRLQKRLAREGDGGIVHKLRGHCSNNTVDEELKQRAVSIYRGEMWDYGPTLACEKLFERHGIKLCPETLRKWLLAAGLWQRKRKRNKHRSRRERRKCLGELVQIDASHHRWAEGRGEKMVLCAMIDDATSRILARFYDAETTENYLDLLGRYVRLCGRPVALYSDRAGIFRTERSKRETEQDFHPQVARALDELDVRLILANSPQAKGRVERLFGTLQDRWVKEMREKGVKTIAEANTLLENKLLAQFNDRFAVAARVDGDAHRPAPEQGVLESVLCVQSERVVANDYTVRYGNKVYQIPPPALSGLRGGRVVVERRLDGQLKLRFKDKYLAWLEITSPAAAPARGGSSRRKADSSTLEGMGTF
jgi:hypothetical protein